MAPGSSMAALKQLAVDVMLWAVLLGAGFTVGAAWQYAAAHEAQAKRADRERAAVAQAVDRALTQARQDAAAEAAALAEQLRLNASYSATLQERLTHATRLVTTPRCTPALAALVRPAGRAAAAAAASGAAPAQAASPDAHAGANPGAAGADATPAPGGWPDVRVGLTLGAVSLWNSALAGADVPAGACRPDDAAGQACAADSGLELIHAWLNHAVNAASCAADRARYERLIAYLQRRSRSVNAAHD